MGSHGAWAAVIVVIEYITSAAMEANDMSRPPAAKTTKKPSPNMPVTTDARAMSKMLEICQNSGEIAPTTTLTSTINSSVKTGGWRISHAMMRAGDAEPAPLEESRQNRS